MVTTIAVRYTIPDARATVLVRKLRGLGYKIEDAMIVDRYTVDARFNGHEIGRCVPLFAEPTTQMGKLNKDLAPPRFTAAIEIGFLPGVTDNVGTTALQTIEDFLKKKFGGGEGVYSSRIIYLTGKMDAERAKLVALEMHNPLIERATITLYRDYDKKKGLPVAVPRVALGKAPEANEVYLEISERELAAIGREGIANPDGSRRGPLALDLRAMKVIRNHFRKLKRNPMDIELEALAQTWSEHCKHTIFADPLDNIKEGIFKHYIKAATERITKKKKGFCVSVFKDNAGAIAFDDDFLITHKVETHNSPSALDPFGGAITGIVGVNRDALGFGLGAKPIANTYGYCVADPASTQILYRDKAGSQPLLSARRILEGVVAGTNAGGNQSGIPTPAGFLLTDDRFRGKPLVFAGTVGLIPRKVNGRLVHEKSARPGDYIVMLGGRVGIDGVHGATFSSTTLDSGSPATAVQIGDPITQKKMSDAIVREARDRDLYTSITDNGAGGLSSSISETARDMKIGKGGCVVHLEKVPLKYPGLAPWQIWISESQERMTLSVPPKKWPAFKKLMESRGAEATVIGTFTASGRCIVKYGGRTVMDLDMNFLHEGRPVNEQKTMKPHLVQETKQLSVTKNLNALFKEMLGRPNVGGFSFISDQYDHEVQAGSVTKPLQGRGRVNGEAAVIRPVLASKKGAVLSQALFPWYTEGDPYRAAAAAIDGALRNAVVAGADPSRVAILDNFCWCSSTDPVRLYQLKEAARACYDYAVAYGTPFISGKDSMFNDFNGFDAKGNPVAISALPTLLISSIGIMDNLEHAVTLDPKSPGDIIYLLGETDPEEIAASEYEALEREKNGGRSLRLAKIPGVDARRHLAIYKKFHAAVKRGLVASAIGVSRGGLGIALAKMAIAGELGITASLKGVRAPKDASALEMLFSESTGRILVTVNPARAKSFKAHMKGVHCFELVKVSSRKTIDIRGRRGEKVISLPVAAAAVQYRKLTKQFP